MPHVGADYALAEKTAWCSRIPDDHEIARPRSADPCDQQPVTGLSVGSMLVPWTTKRLGRVQPNATTRAVSREAPAFIAAATVGKVMKTGVMKTSAGPRTTPNEGAPLNAYR